ncbi:MAG TPA: Lrp/AsnC family transcriptional regulator, partial [Candidatus Methanoperedens sp.]
MDQIDLKLLKTIQDGIPIISEPFKHIAKEVGLSERDVLARVHNLVKEGAIRRFGASIGHRAIGITANA